MTRNTHLLALATVAVAMLSAQLASAAPAPPVDLGPNKSVRPNSPQIRTSVNPLLGWQVGISSSVFGPLTFSEAAGLADALGLATIEGNSGQKVSPQIDKNSGLSTFARGDRCGQSPAGGVAAQDDRLPGRKHPLRRELGQQALCICKGAGRSRPS